jgi:hypothetical protein
MQHIFTAATSVWVWLGEANELFERGLVTLVNQTDSYASYRLTGAAIRPLPLPHFLSSTLSLDEIVYFIKQFAAVDKLPYWRRGWTFQENMSPRKHICCGKLRVELRSWRAITATCYMFARNMRGIKRILSFRPSISPLLSESELEFLYAGDPLVDTFMPFSRAEDFLEPWVKHQFGQPYVADHESKTASSALSATLTSSLRNVRNRAPNGFIYDARYRTSDPRDSVFALCSFVPGMANIDQAWAQQYIGP